MAERCLETLKDPSNEMEKKERDEKLISIYSNIGHIKSIVSALRLDGDLKKTFFPRF